MARRERRRARAIEAFMAAPPSGDLERILADVWARLARAPGEPRSPLCAPVMATVGLDGGPNARTVALWHVEAGERRLYFNTDARSPKYAELRRDPRSRFVFYDRADPAGEIQLRVLADVRLHVDDALVRAGWIELSPEDRRLFLTARPPGAPALGPTPGIEGTPDMTDESPAGRANFAVIEARVVALDWLHISPVDGHRRAVFRWDDAGRLRASWVYP